MLMCSSVLLGLELLSRTKQYRGGAETLQLFTDIGMPACKYHGGQTNSPRCQKNR